MYNLLFNSIFKISNSTIMASQEQQEKDTDIFPRLYKKTLNSHATCSKKFLQLDALET